MSCAPPGRLRKKREAKFGFIESEGRLVRGDQAGDRINATSVSKLATYRYPYSTVGEEPSCVLADLNAEFGSGVDPDAEAVNAQAGIKSEAITIGSLSSNGERTHYVTTAEES
jgi:hypothetical protein